jgi:hypothetical protein
MRVNPRTGQLEQIGSAPAGSHFVTEPPPRDNSAADMRKDNQVQGVHRDVTTKIDAVEKPISVTQDGLEKLDIALRGAMAGDNQQARGLAAISELKAFVAGGGVRLTQPEINTQLAGARTKWDNFQLMLNTFDSTGESPLQITNKQLADISALSTALRKKVRKHQDLIDTTRNAVDDASAAGNVDAMNRAYTKLHQALKEEEEPSTDVAAPAGNRIYYDDQGKPKKSGGD